MKIESSIRLVFVIFCNNFLLNLFFAKLWCIFNSFRVGFVRFSNYADAVRALGEMDGYNLRGFSLIVNPATQRGTLQNTKDSKGKKEDSKDRGTKKNKNTAMVNGIENNKTLVKDTKLGSSIHSSLSSPKENRTVVQAESWETDGWLSPKTPPAGNMKFFSQDDIASRVHEEDGSYAVHVSNFPVGTTKVKLKTESGAQTFHHFPLHVCNGFFFVELNQNKYLINTGGQGGLHRIQNCLKYIFLAQMDLKSEVKLRT